MKRRPQNFIILFFLVLVGFFAFEFLMNQFNQMMFSLGIKASYKAKNFGLGVKGFVSLVTSLFIFFKLPAPVVSEEKTEKDLSQGIDLHLPEAHVGIDESAILQKIYERKQHAINLNLHQKLFFLYKQVLPFFSHPFEKGSLPEFSSFILNLKKGKIKNKGNEVECLKISTINEEYILAHQPLNWDLKVHESTKNKMVELYLIYQNNVVLELKINHDIELDIDIETFSWGKDDIISFIPGQWVDPFSNLIGAMMELHQKKLNEQFVSLELEKIEDLKKKFGL